MENNTQPNIIIGSEFPKQIIPLIKAAQHSIKIIVYDWRWYPSDIGSPCQRFNHEIIQAHRRGINIEVITNIDQVIRTLNEQGIKARRLQSKRLVHVKLMIIDDTDAIIGSHNYTQNAFTLNYELSIHLPKMEGIDRLLTFFNKLYNYD